MYDLYDFRKFELKNGLTVFLKETPTKTVATRLKVKLGSASETDEQEGITHFLEHCIGHTGSENYSQEEIDEIYRNFGDFNQISSLEKTIFLQICLGKLYLFGYY